MRAAAVECVANAAHQEGGHDVRPDFDLHDLAGIQLGARADSDSPRGAEVSAGHAVLARRTSRASVEGRAWRVAPLV